MDLPSVFFFIFGINFFKILLMNLEIDNFRLDDLRRTAKNAQNFLWSFISKKMLLVRNYLREKLIGQKVYLVLEEHNDKYGRLLGELFYDKELTESINQDIIDRGYGKSYGGGTKEGFWLEELKTIVEELDD